MNKSELYRSFIGLHAIYHDNIHDIQKTLNLHLDYLSEEEANDFYTCVKVVISQDNMEAIINDFDHKRLLAVLTFYVRNGELSIRDIQSIKTDSQRIELIGEHYPHYLMQQLFFAGNTPWLFVQLFFEFNDLEHNLFIHYLSKKKVRNFQELPLTITKREEQLFLSFPKDRIIYGGGRSLTKYLLFVKVVNIIRSDKLEEFLYHSRLFSFDNVDKIISKWEKWHNVFHFLKRNANELTRSQVHEIIDFLIEKMIRTDGGAKVNFKHIKLASLHRYIEDWHLELYLKKLDRNATWTSAESFTGKYTDRQSEYEIVEITKAVDLFAEGKELQHCVKTYLDGCIKGLYSIWSLRRVVSRSEFRRLVTIQVHEGEIIQARGFKNRSIECDEARMLELWAKENNLRFRLEDFDEDLPFLCYGY